MLKEGSIRSKLNVVVQNKFDALNVKEQEQGTESKGTVKRKWGNLKNALQRTAEEILPTKGIAKKQRWMAVDILGKWISEE